MDIPSLFLRLNIVWLFLILQLNQTNFRDIMTSYAYAKERYYE